MCARSDRDQKSGTLVINCRRVTLPAWIQREGDEDGFKEYSDEAAGRLLGMVNGVVIAVGLARIYSHKILREKPYVAHIFLFQKSPVKVPNNALVPLIARGRWSSASTWTWN